MGFPVDLLETTSHEELKCSADIYTEKLLYSDPYHADYFTLPNGEKVQLNLCNVGPIPLYGVNSQYNVLALFTPQDPYTVVALYLNCQWYALEDILKTAKHTREGLIEVRTVGERIVLFILNSIIYRTHDMDSGEMPFLCHSENDYAKILWKNGQAVGFYSVKLKGSVANTCFGQCYLLPVMDSMYVRKAHRRKGYGLQMLEDFVDSFKEDELGMKYPLSPAMINVCRHYLNLHPADGDLFWEVEDIGGPYQRTSVAYILTSRLLKQIRTQISTFFWTNENRSRKRVREEEEANGVDHRPDKINRFLTVVITKTRVETAEEKKKELVFTDGPESLVLEEPDDAYPVETSKQRAAKHQKASAEVEDNQEMDVDSVVHVPINLETSLAAEDNPASKEPPSLLFSPPEGEQGQEEVTDIVKRREASGVKENTLMEEEEEEVLKEDEMEEEEDETSPVFSVDRKARRKAVRPTSKITIKKLRWKARGRRVGGKSGRRGRQKEQKGKKRREGRSRAQRRRGGAREDPTEISVRVLRGRTIVIKTTKMN